MVQVLILGESDREGLSKSTGELLAVARILGPTPAVVLFAPADDLSVRDAFAFGASTVYISEMPAQSGVEAYVNALEQVFIKTRPSVLLFARTDLGKELAPRLAFRVGAGIAQDCFDIRLDSSTGCIEATRPVYGGNAVARVKFKPGVARFLVIKPKVYEPPSKDDSRKGEAIHLALDTSSLISRVRHIRHVTRESEGVRLEDAPVVVCGGRGIGSKEGMDQIAELARLLGGAVGATRAVCDADWADYDRQIGLTGKSVAPELCISVGVSGASQHMSGCAAAKHTIAINRDRGANIFKYAEFGVVGDWRKVLPTFMATIRSLKNS